MAKFPLLEQLRAERLRQENEVTSPLRENIASLQRQIHQVTASLRVLERALGSEIGKIAVEYIGREVGSDLRQHILEATSKAYRMDNKVFTLAIPAEVVRFMDPHSLESEILQRFTDETAHRLSARAETRQEDRVTIMDIRIPELGYRRAMAELN